MRVKCLTPPSRPAGRSVMLEQPRGGKAPGGGGGGGAGAGGGSKFVSHMLTSHAGEIYLHVLATSRSPLEDPPSISEGAGGRLTDYRINVSAGGRHTDYRINVSVGGK